MIMICDFVPENYNVLNIKLLEFDQARTWKLEVLYCKSLYYELLIFKAF